MANTNAEVLTSAYLQAGDVIMTWIAYRVMTRRTVQMTALMTNSCVSCLEKGVSHRPGFVTMTMTVLMAKTREIVIHIAMATHVGKLVDTCTQVGSVTTTMIAQVLMMKRIVQV